MPAELDRTREAIRVVIASMEAQHRTAYIAVNSVMSEQRRKANENALQRLAKIAQNTRLASSSISQQLLDNGTLPTTQSHPKTPNHVLAGASAGSLNCDAQPTLASIAGAASSLRNPSPTIPETRSIGSGTGSSTTTNHHQTASAVVAVPAGNSSTDFYGLLANIPSDRSLTEAAFRGGGTNPTKHAAAGAGGALPVALQVGAIAANPPHRLSGSGGSLGAAAVAFPSMTSPSSDGEATTTSLFAGIPLYQSPSQSPNIQPSGIPSAGTASTASSLHRIPLLSEAEHPLLDSGPPLTKSALMAKLMGVYGSIGQSSPPDPPAARGSGNSAMSTSLGALDAPPAVQQQLRRERASTAGERLVPSAPTEQFHDGPRQHQQRFAPHSETPPPVFPPPPASTTQDMASFTSPMVALTALSSSNTNTPDEFSPVVDKRDVMAKLRNLYEHVASTTVSPTKADE